MTEPLVSILCTVYGQGAMVGPDHRQFFGPGEGFSAGDFLLIDDASTDGSKAIIDRYQDQYPDLIRAFYNSEIKALPKPGGHLPRGAWLLYRSL